MGVCHECGCVVARACNKCTRACALMCVCVCACVCPTHASGAPRVVRARTCRVRVRVRVRGLCVCAHVRVHVLMLRALCGVCVCVCASCCADFMSGAPPCNITQTHDGYKKKRRAALLRTKRKGIKHDDGVLSPDNQHSQSDSTTWRLSRGTSNTSRVESGAIHHSSSTESNTRAAPQSRA